LDPGVTYGKNEFVISNFGLDNIKRTSQGWTPSVVQDFNLAGDLPSQGSTFFLSNDGTTFGVAINGALCRNEQEVCQGYSTPQLISNGTESINTTPHFQISCGQETYFGPNLDHFTSVDATGVVRPYICDSSMPTLRVIVKLIGYFVDGICAAFESATYDENYCIEEREGQIFLKNESMSTYQERMERWQAIFAP